MIWAARSCRAALPLVDAHVGPLLNLYQQRPVLRVTPLLRGAGLWVDGDIESFFSAPRCVGGGHAACAADDEDIDISGVAARFAAVARCPRSEDQDFFGAGKIGELFGDDEVRSEGDQG